MTNERLLAAGLEQLSGVMNKCQMDMNKTLARLEGELAGVKKQARHNADMLDRTLRSPEASAKQRAAEQMEYRSFMTEMKQRLEKLEEAGEKTGAAEGPAQDTSADAFSGKSMSGAKVEPLLAQADIGELSQQPGQGWPSVFGSWPQTDLGGPGVRPKEAATVSRHDAAFSQPAADADPCPRQVDAILWAEPRRSKGGYVMAALAILLLVSTLAAALALNVDIKEQPPADATVSIPLRTLSSLDTPSKSFNDTVFGVEIPGDLRPDRNDGNSLDDWEKKRTYNSIVQMANFGNPAAQTVLGLWAVDDTGAAPVDLQAAVRYLTLAAQQGQAVAQYRLGSLYEHADGVPPDLAKAAYWYELAAKQGNRRAMHNLAVFAVAGAVGKTNMQEAAHWFEDAALLGLPDSQYMLAVLYEQGDGVPPSLVQAYKWDLIASQSGSPQARKHIQALKRRMNRVDLEAAAKLAAAFRPKPLNEAANNPPQPRDL
jgi:hypothetical protein